MIRLVWCGYGDGMMFEVVKYVGMIMFLKKKNWNVKEYLRKVLLIFWFRNILSIIIEVFIWEVKFWFL